MYRITFFSLAFLMWCYFVFSDSFRIDCTALRSLRSSGCNLRMVAERVALVVVQGMLYILTFWGIHLTTSLVDRAMAERRDRSPRARKRGQASSPFRYARGCVSSFRESDVEYGRADGSIESEDS